MTVSHLGHSVLPTRMATGLPSVRPCRTPPVISTSSCSNFIRAPRPYPARRRASAAAMSALVISTPAGIPSQMATSARPVRLTRGQPAHHVQILPPAALARVMLSTCGGRRTGRGVAARPTLPSPGAAARRSRRAGLPRPGLPPRWPPPGCTRRPASPGGPGRHGPPGGRPSPSRTAPSRPPRPGRPVLGGPAGACRPGGPAGAPPVATSAGYCCRGPVLPSPRCPRRRRPGWAAPGPAHSDRPRRRPGQLRHVLRPGPVFPARPLARRGQ